NFGNCFRDNDSGLKSLLPLSSLSESVSLSSDESESLSLSLSLSLSFQRAETARGSSLGDEVNDMGGLSAGDVGPKPAKAIILGTKVSGDVLSVFFPILRKRWLSPFGDTGEEVVVGDADIGEEVVDCPGLVIVDEKTVWRAARRGGVDF